MLYLHAFNKIAVEAVVIWAILAFLGFFVSSNLYGVWTYMDIYCPSGSNVAFILISADLDFINRYAASTGLC